MKQIENKDLPSDYLANLQFSVFAMGDSHYVHFNSAGTDLDKRLGELGAQRIKEVGLGDDQVRVCLVPYLKYIGAVINRVQRCLKHLALKVCDVYCSFMCAKLFNASSLGFLAFEICVYVCILAAPHLKP